jgi:hypothetical protein
MISKLKNLIKDTSALVDPGALSILVIFFGSWAWMRLVVAS